MPYTQQVDLLASDATFAGKTEKCRNLRSNPLAYFLESPGCGFRQEFPFLSLLMRFEANHKDVRLVFVDLGANYYKSTLVAAFGVGETKPQADVVEVDTVFLRDLVNDGKVQALPDALVAKDGTFLPIAEQAATLDGKVYGVPHWVCGDFVFFRKDDPDRAKFESTTTLKQLEASLGTPDIEEHGLIADAAGKSTLGELYLHALLNEYGTPEEVITHLGTKETPDSKAAAAVTKLAKLCPGGVNHSPNKYHYYGAFYSRQFAHRKARLLLSYSEGLFAVGDEYHEPGIGKPGTEDLGVIPAPLADTVGKMLGWVDVLTVPANVSGQAKEDALAFIAEFSSEDFNRAILTPSDVDPPRYLLPARARLYEDPTVTKAAPLYPRFKEIMLGAIPISAPHLNGNLRSIAEKLDSLIDGSP